MISLIKEGTGMLQRIPVKYIANDNEKKLDILDNGQVVVHASSIYKNYPQELNNYLIRDIQKFLSPLDTNIYLRVSDKKEDYEHLINKTHRGSFNHANGKAENGLSVAKFPETPSKYYYFIKGDKIGEGTDGEPLLDVNKIEVVSKRMTAKEFSVLWNEMCNKKIKELGLSEEDARLLKATAKVVG